MSQESATADVSASGSSYVQPLVYGYATLEPCTSAESGNVCGNSDMQILESKNEEERGLTSSNQKIDTGVENLGGVTMIPEGQDIGTSISKGGMEEGQRYIQPYVYGYPLLQYSADIDELEGQNFVGYHSDSGNDFLQPQMHGCVAEANTGDNWSTESVHSSDDWNDSGSDNNRHAEGGGLLSDSSLQDANPKTVVQNSDLTKYPDSLNPFVGDLVDNTKSGIDYISFDSIPIGRGDSETPKTEKEDSGKGNPDQEPGSQETKQEYVVPQSHGFPLLHSRPSIDLAAEVAEAEILSKLQMLQTQENAENADACLDVS